MRRKRRGSGRDVLIDLTSLLDVMFIILLIVMWGQNNTEDQLRQQQAEAEQAQVQTEQEYRLYKDQLETADSLNQLVWAVSVIVPYDETDVTKRQIQILKEGEQIESFDLVGNRVTDTVEKFKQSLVTYIEANKDKPVILSLNEEDDYILYRDELMVKEIFSELSAEYNNVYLKGSVNEEEQ